MKMKFVLLTIVLLLLSGVPALADEAPHEYSSGEWTYILKADGTAEITGYVGGVREVIVPDVLDGYPVTSIGERVFMECPQRTCITVAPGSYAETWARENGYAVAYIAD